MIRCCATTRPLLGAAPDHRLASPSRAARSRPRCWPASVTTSSSSMRRIICATSPAPAINWSIGLQKRFLLLLSATPVQNSLLELYNLLTLLQPGIFKTQKEFRSVYMVPGKPREPANRDRLRDLMRGVMVRNTRALAALRMPRRHASTLRVDPGRGRSGRAIEELATLVREAAARQRRRTSVVAAASAGRGRLFARRRGRRDCTLCRASSEDRRWTGLLARTRAICRRRQGDGAAAAAGAESDREEAGVRPSPRQPGPVWRTSLRRQDMPFALFSTATCPARRRTRRWTAFRDQVPVLLCTESGGEGRNLQFCNTLINFDIPWNPMAIEQRIGRIDRIGQTREVFVFNLVTAGTIEERCCASWTRRSTCSNWSSARSAPSWVKSTSSRISPRWCWMHGCKALNRPRRMHSTNWSNSCSPHAGNMRA